MKMTTKDHKGMTLIELLIVVAIIGILAATAIPNLLSAQRKAKYARSASDSKLATTQAITYANDESLYPTSIQIMRDGGYGSIPDDDPWGEAYQLSPVLTSGSAPAIADDVYVYSKGASKTGTYPSPFTTDTGFAGSVGYSSVYGSWTGN